MSLPFPEIDPVAIAIGPLEIRWYALAYLAGFLIGWKYCLYLAGLDKEVKPFKTDIDDFLPWAILGVIAGGRLGYVLFYQLEFYLQQPWEIPMIWHGGMAFHGGLLGVAVALFLFSRYQHVPLMRLADILACAVPIGLFFGRIANFINCELVGRVTHMPWAVEFPCAGDLARHPSQLYQAGLEGLALLGIMAFLAHREALRNKPGVLAGVFLVFYGIFRFIAEFFREPDLQIGFIAEIFTMGQMLCVPMVLCGLGIIYWCGLRRTQPT